MQKAEKGQKQNKEDGKTTKKWPITKRDLIRRNREEFIKLINDKI